MARSTKGAPSFVSEEPGHGYEQNEAALDDIHAYVRNLAYWLAPEGKRRV